MPTDSFPELLPLAWSAALALPLAAIAGAALDRLLGEPRRWHPLVGFGALAEALEAALNGGRGRTLRGLLAWSLLVLPVPALVLWLKPAGLAGWAVDVVLLYLALGGRSLGEHASRVAGDLARGDLALARRHVGWMVSRQTENLDDAGVASACVESTLENGNDAVFAALFWFALLGGPGALLFRLANTLDAMWGYRNERFADFGCAAARLDDLLGFVPARLTALSYALCGRTRSALRCWRAQAPNWKSPNAGPVMAAGAGSLGVALGGAAVYHGRREQRPLLGEGRTACADDIGKALTLLRRCLLLWLATILCWGLTRA
ncbi:adenosylcobinamide-phosphate synthase CbiB [Candidatus Accumulibacter sp. ACC003]|uniref:adenosylcobinamide-phosphate synthase CbiB n=1 Tax=Candidatus Accumulibacter sp. ACC003 TaxID=2823334 RepID=UPI0025B88665|nr:adenosylcobinamide-phosphate synthase CbiB [Candidatus Accumulibacter sp. ACC003]